MNPAIHPTQHPHPRAEAASAQTVATLIAQYEKVEGLCEKAIERQEGLARQIYAEPARGDDPAPSEIGFGEFRQMHALARKVVPGGLPNASRRFVMKARAPGVVEIEELEETIRLCRGRMTAIEQDILNLAPASVEDATAKLKFMASLMLDGGNLEVDFFAYLVEECAFVIAARQPCA
jgi:hypothetical protein